MIKYYLYLSKLQHEKGYEDDAFISLDEAVSHAKKLKNLSVGNNTYTAFLIKECSFNIIKKLKFVACCLQIGHGGTYHALINYQLKLCLIKNGLIG